MKNTKQGITISQGIYAQADIGYRCLNNQVRRDEKCHKLKGVRDSEDKPKGILEVCAIKNKTFEFVH